MEQAAWFRRWLDGGLRQYKSECTCNDPFFLVSRGANLSEVKAAVCPQNTDGTWPAWLADEKSGTKSVVHNLTLASLQRPMLVAEALIIQTRTHHSLCDVVPPNWSYQGFKLCEECQEKKRLNYRACN